MSITGADPSPFTGASRGTAGFAPSPFADLNQILQLRAAQTPDAVAYCVLLRGEQPGEAITYRDLDKGARAVAAHLLTFAAPGERVLLLLPAGRDFLFGFFGCLYAGLVAVPADLPRPGRALERLAAIARDCSASIALVPQAAVQGRADLTGALAALGCLCMPVDAAGETVANDLSSPGSNGLALLQYTSGSTADPKGVMVSHGNFLATLADLDGWGHGPQSRMVSWLPVFHDMGLVYGVLQPLYNGFPSYLMNPASFLQRPMRWLRAITQFRATHSAAPNFAYQLCAETAKPDDIAALDLGSWQVALNGAEPVRDAVLTAFAERFAPCGFHPDTFCPGYGLAEATLKVSTKPRGTRLRRFQADVVALQQGRAESTKAGGTVLVGVGRSDIGARIAIVDPATSLRAAPGHVGEIWVSSASVAQGYWQRPRETQAAFGARLADTDEGPFLRTGDLGFIDSGDLFVTGRLKDLIIVQGRNHYPQDIEATVQSADPALRADHGAAFSVPGADGERLVVVQEVRRSHLAGLVPAAILGNIRAAVSEAHDLRASSILLAAPGTVPKTTSGKIQRSRCRALYLAGALPAVHASDPFAPTVHSSPPEHGHAVTIAD